MRFLANAGSYGCCVQRQINEHYATGQQRTIQREISAKFAIGGLTEQERELALRSFTFNGFYQEQDEVTIVPPDYRIGLFDTRRAQESEGWSNEERELVETTLLEKAARLPGEVCVVPEIRVPAPWPRYDEFEGGVLALMSKILEDGYELGPILAYENENQDRPEVVQALLQLIADTTPAQVEEVVG